MDIACICQFFVKFQRKLLGSYVHPYCILFKHYRSVFIRITDMMLVMKKFLLLSFEHHLKISNLIINNLLINWLSLISIYYVGGNNKCCVVFAF
jgi:hypothetical protein